MGLSLCYEFRVPTDAERARQLVSQWRDFALTCDFEEVLDLVEVGPRDPSPDEPADPDALTAEQVELLRIFGAQYGQKRAADGTELWIDIPPKHVIAFGIQSAEGAEIAQIGLASHPAVLEREHEGQTLLIETGLAGRYSWTQCCKTQYAGLLQNGGWDNFRKAHTGLVALFDFIASQDVEVDVQDDSEYWDRRDEDALRDGLHEWNRMMAALAGQLKDQLGAEPDGRVTGPILTAPDFERLEAQGMTEWDARKQSSGDVPDDRE